jgi:hypothetical protein
VDWSIFTLGQVGGIINPITTANTILAADIDGMPVLASTVRATKANRLTKSSYAATRIP